MWRHPAAPRSYGLFANGAVFGPAIPIIAVAASVIGTGVSMYGAEQSAHAQQQSANYQAAVARNNQITANAEATYATSAGESQQQSQAMTTRALIGNEKAAQASSGLDVNSGSSVNVRSSAAELGTLSGLNIKSNAALKAAEYRAQAGSFGSQSTLDTMTAENAGVAGTLSAAGAGISGVGNLASMGYRNTILTGSMFGTTPSPYVTQQNIVH